MGTGRTIVWQKAALQYLEEAVDYIRKDSPQNANLVATAIINTVEKAAKAPEHFPPDKYKMNNEGHAYRAFEIYGFRISFYHSTDTLRIVRVRHVKQQPLSY